MQFLKFIWETAGKFVEPMLPYPTNRYHESLSAKSEATLSSPVFML